MKTKRCGIMTFQNFVLEQGKKKEFIYTSFIPPHDIVIEERDQFKLPCLSLSWTLGRNDSMTSKVIMTFPQCQLVKFKVTC